MVSAQLVKWTSRLLRWMQPTRRGLQEAADQQHGKQSKLTTFNHLTMENDLRKLAAADRDAVEEFRNRKMGIKGGGKSGDSDAWVCDDMTINNSGKSNLLELALLLLLGLGGMYYINKDKAPTPQEVNVDDSEYEVRFFDKDGNLITVPHISQKPKEG